MRLHKFYVYLLQMRETQDRILTRARFTVDFTNCFLIGYNVMAVSAATYKDLFYFSLRC